jgi:hypothetical protein
MTSRKDTARAIAYFENTDDVMLLHELTREIAPRVKKLVRSMLSRTGEEGIPTPADLYPATNAAPRDEAVAIVRATDDFALLQALARSIGRRIEAIEIVASAEFPEGTRVTVPEAVAFPPSGPRATGVVRETGTTLTVQLDNGERWVGPPSLAQREVS